MQLRAQFLQLAVKIGARLYTDCKLQPGGRHSQEVGYWASIFHFFDGCPKNRILIARNLFSNEVSLCETCPSVSPVQPVRQSPFKSLEQSSWWICSSSSRVLSDSNLDKGNWKSGIQSGVFYNNLYPMKHFHGTRPALVRYYYDVLEVSKNASASDIKKASYALAKKLHPDTNKDDAEAERKFQEVSLAYELAKKLHPDTNKDDAEAKKNSKKFLLFTRF